MNNNLVKIGIPLGIIAVVMGVTNPQSKAYNEYAYLRLISDGDRLICKKYNYCSQWESLPPLVKNTVKNRLEKIIDSATKRQNLIFFSFYTTEVPEIGTFRTIGIFGNFFTYSKQ
jgi:hypothetical protein